MSCPTHVQSNAHVVLRLPSGALKVAKIIPDTVISLGKYGNVAANSLLHKPYYLTFEVLDKSNEGVQDLRLVTAAELHAEHVAEEDTLIEPHGESNGVKSNGVEYDIIGEDGQILVRSNRLTIDDPSRQALTYEEIEELKKAETGSGREIIAKIMQSHSALEEKTSFSLAKYTLRKTKKYIRRFTVLPLDTCTLTQWMLNEKEPMKIMELREEMLGLIASWSNVHRVEGHVEGSSIETQEKTARGRWLVIDDTGGLIVAVLAERMGILYPQATNDTAQDNDPTNEPSDHKDVEGGMPEASTNGIEEVRSRTTPKQRKPRRHPPDAMSASTNTITMLHPTQQPNISLLSYFSYNPNDPSQSPADLSASSHPLHTHLKSLSWLQLISPELDPSYQEPEFIPDSTLSTFKSSKRGTYHRKRRRWERTKRIVDETRAGGFDGLVIASVMAPQTILHHAVPLLVGGAPIVVYSPSIEPLLKVADLYSSARKTACLNALADGATTEDLIPSDDFPVDPRLVLAPTLQTARAREWQVLPGRTHPLMMSRGGAEGYLFTGSRVIPSDSRVTARGTHAKRRKVDAADSSNTPQTKQEVSDVEMRSSSGDDVHES